MECYNLEFLRMACKDHNIPHSRLSKKEMYDKLVEINAIDEDPRKKEPVPIRRQVPSTPSKMDKSGKEGKEKKEGKKEIYYLGEEYRMYDTF